MSKVAKQHLAGLGRNLRPGRLRMVAVAVLCGACGSGVPLALQDERTFFLNFSSGTITGQFNPAGFSNDEVEEVADWMCGRGRLDEFAAEPQETGLTEIEAQCLLSDITGFGRTEARRRGDNGSIDVTYRGTTQNGRLLRRQRI
ncbi:MAG: hypothetical protein AAF681_14155 [Pseudomonadota bacterium]